MSKRILFIDDDRALLNTMQRNLSFDFDIETAESYTDAIQVIEEKGPFSVIVVDMQMPGQNGIECIEKLRGLLPDAVYMMLTGNQDQATVIRAVNDGQVFRFLNKPCELTSITIALEAAQKQHELIIAEKELLHGTFMSSINLMSDIIEMDGNRRIETARMANSIKKLLVQLSNDVGWEEKVAPRICLVGIAWLEPQELLNFDSLDPVTKDHREIVKKIFVTSSKMIAKIPRLEWISDVLRLVPSTESYSTRSDRKAVTAICLRSAFYWNYLTLRGISADETTATIHKILPDLNSSLCKALGYLDDNRDAHALIKIRIRDLGEGMVLNQDLVARQGGTILTGGRRLTNRMIENVSRIAELADQKVSVVENSCPQFRPA